MNRLPAWSEAFASDRLPDLPALPLADARDWAFGGATGAGVSVAIVDSGVDADHPDVGGVASAVAMEPDDSREERYRAVEGPHEDLVGHGTACAAIVRSIAPDVELHSVRVLGSNLKGRGLLFHAGLQWVVAHGLDVANLSLSSKSEAMFAPLHDVADRAYFARTLLVCAANNQPGPTYPSEFASVVSVACRPGEDPWTLSCNPNPPVEFGARGIDVEVAWAGGGHTVATGNSFAAPHVAAMAALIVAKHPGLAPYQVKAVLQAVSDNAVRSSGGTRSAGATRPA
jgi:subtilisin family serine protease